MLIQDAADRIYEDDLTSKMMFLKAVYSADLKWETDNLDKKRAEVFMNLSRAYKGKDKGDVFRQKAVKALNYYIETKCPVKDLRASQMTDESL